MLRSNLDECDEFYIGESKMEHRNRDYFTKPIQGGGRDAWDYGNTKLSRDESICGIWNNLVGIVATGIVLAGLYILAVMVS